MTPAHESLLNLCSALGIDLRGLSDDVCDIIALRIHAEDILPTKPAVKQIIDEVRRAEGGTAETPSLLSDSGDAQPPSAPHRKMRYLATEATDAKYRERMATVHRIEDHRSGLDLRPRRPDPLGPLAVHAPCKAAYQDGGECCSRCAPLLHDPDCTCPSCDYALGVQE